MRILIDLQGAQSESRYRGIGRYSLSLALAVAKHAREHDVHILLNGAFADTISPIREAFDGVLCRDRIHVWYAPLPLCGKDQNADAQERGRWAEIIREAAISSLVPDVVHVSSIFDGYVDSTVVSVGALCDAPTVVTLYDLIPLMNREHYLDPAPDYKKFYEQRLQSLRCADALVAISASAADEAVNILGFDAGRVFNISGACDDVFRPLPDGLSELADVKAKFGLDRDFVLYTGGSDERKNLPRLVEAYAGLPAELRSRYRLVMAGRMHQPHVDELRQLAEKFGMAADELVFLGYVSDSELVALYNLCRLFVFPSWHEGFGLPVLEAMSCGAAVLASDASSIREVATFKDALFDPMDVESIKASLARFIDDSEGLKELRDYSLSRAGAFSWEKVANRLIDAFESVGGRNDSQSLDVVERAVALLAQNSLPPMSVVALADALDRSVAAELPQILIDVSDLAAHDHKTGIQRVTRSIVAEWIAHPPAGYRVQLVRIDRENRRYICANEFAARFRVGDSDDVIADSPLVCHAGDVFLGLDLVGDAVPLLPDWFDYFRSVGVLISFVVYDILPVRHPEWWPQGGGWHHERWLRSIVSSADKLICISRTVAEDVRDWIRETGTPTRAELGWFHLGADIKASHASSGLPADSEVVIQSLAVADSFLMVGTIEPRKGHAQALAAFEALWAAGEEVHLVIVGKRGWLVDGLCEALASHPQRGHRLFWLEAISDEYLERVYNASSCLLAASEGEGFGLPLIEAAQRGKPVLARDIAVFREVAGENASYFKGLDAGALAAAVLQWKGERAQGRGPEIRELRWLTWKESAAELQGELLPDSKSRISESRVMG